MYASPCALGVPAVGSSGSFQLSDLTELWPDVDSEGPSSTHLFFGFHFPSPLQVDTVIRHQKSDR